MGIPEIEDAGCLLCFGYNGADSHPIVARRIVRGKQKGMKIICADPRVTETARISDIHLQLKGGSNLALVNAMANVIWNEGLADKKFIDEHTKGFDEFLKVIEKYTPEYAEPITHIPAETIRRAARMYATTKPAMILYGMGVCQFTQAVDVVKGLANLALRHGSSSKLLSGLSECNRSGNP